MRVCRTRFFAVPLQTLPVHVHGSIYIILSELLGSTMTTWIDASNACMVAAKASYKSCSNF